MCGMTAKLRGNSVSEAVATTIETLTRGCEHVYTIDELKARLDSGKRLRVKLGMDPTAPDLHLGHSVVLRKLRQFQDAGHKAVLIIGDYTAMIGDPTGKSKTRPVLTKQEVDANAQTYFDQAGKILDLSEDKLEVRRNSEWLTPLRFADVIRLMSQMTVARMLERDTFAERQKAEREIHLHELLYPLMQARDSVEIQADVELGGTDQTFNNLCGRDLQRNAGQPPQIVMTLPLLIGTDGKEKMSKSLGNYIGVTDAPSDMFGKVMHIKDQFMPSYFELLTDVPQPQITERCDPTRHNPRDTKEYLAKVIITEYHSVQAAEAAADEFRRKHSASMDLSIEGRLPDHVPDVTVPAEIVENGTVAPVDLVVTCLGEKSRSEARRIILERGIRLNGQVVESIEGRLDIKTGDVLQRGKRKFIRLLVQ